MGQGEQRDHPALPSGAAPDPSAPAAAPPRGPARVLALGTRGGTDPYALRGPYTALHLATSGFTPTKSRIVEVGVVRVDGSGRTGGEWSTLVAPPGGLAGPSFLHGLLDADLDGAPGWGSAGRDLLARLEGSVVVAHRADLAGQFLAAEFLAAGLLAPSLPALDLFRLAQQSLPLPNHRLSTLAAHFGLPAPCGAALPDARLVAALVPRLVTGVEDELRYPVPLAPLLSQGRPPGPVSPRRHLAAPPPGDPWLHAFMHRLRSGAREVHEPRVGAYLEALGRLLVQGRIVSEEVRVLARLAAEAGYGAGDIRAMLEHLLESMRQAAFEERALPATRLRHLRAAAASVGIPGYFDDLVPPAPPPAPAPGSGSFARPVRKPPPPAPPARRPRCGRCLEVGHYTSACPRRRHAGYGRVPPVDPISPV